MKKRILCAALSIVLCFVAVFPACGVEWNAGQNNLAPVFAMTDVPRNAWYIDAVNWAMVNGITNGKTATTFAPNDTCTRAQVVTFLWLAAGEPEPSDSRNPFEDVPETAYYRKAVLWAVEQGITKGTSATKFSPNQTCSLAHILTFLWRAKNSPDVDYHGALTTQYASHWAAGAIRWAEGTYMLGETAYDFQPGADCSRANAVYYLYHSSVDTRIPMSAERFEEMQEVTFSDTVYEASTVSGFVSAAMTLIQQYEDMSPDDFDDDNPYSSGRLIVNSSETLPDLTDYNAAQIVAGRDGHYIVQFLSPDEAESCAEYLETLSYVDYAEPDIIMKAFSETSETVADAQATPWGVSAIGADAYAADLLRQGVDTELTIAVIDTGVDPSHPHVKDRLVPGYDFVKGDTTARDGNGHGTHVAGTIIDCTPGLNIKIMPIRVLDDNGSGYDSAIAQGIRYAADHGAQVINLSLGGGHSNYMDNAVAYALSKSITVVAASGNENVNAAASCPAHIANCITVAAVDKNHKRASFSNYGDVLDISAPGVEIRSSVPGGEYKAYSGTSMAAPHVSAAAALVLCGQSRQLLPSIVEKKLKDAATPLGDAKEYGAGLLNLAAFVSEEAPETPEPPEPPTDEPGTDAPPMSGNPQTPDAPSAPVYTITLNANGGSVTPSSLTVTQGDSYGTLPAPVRSGYTFEGWHTAPVGGIFVSSTDTPTHTLTLYAHWTAIPSAPVTYTVTLNANGGSVSPSSLTVAQGDSYGTLPTPTRNGYAFDGWHMAPTGGSRVSPADKPTHTLTLYAHWKEIPAEPVAEPEKMSHSGQCGANLTWTLDADGALTVSGQGGMDDYNNASGAVWAQYREEIRFLRVEKGVSSIGASAFAGCGNLISITLPDSLQSIGMSAFANCAKVTDVYYAGNFLQWALLGLGLTALPYGVVMHFGA